MRPRQNRLGRADELRFEQLERRNLLTVDSLTIHEAESSTGSSIAVQDPAGKDIMVPVTATTSDGGAITYTVSSSNSAVTATVVSGDTYLTLNVSGTDSSGTAYTGALTFKLFDSLTPNTVSEITSLVDAGQFTDTTFARVLDTLGNILIAQGGYTSTGGTNGTGNTFDDEFASQLTFDSPGMLAMANAGPDTNDAEFFISGVDEPGTTTPLTQSDLSATRSLDYRYTIFGQLTDGFTTFDKIMNSTVTTNTSTDEDSLPSPLITITSASIATNQTDTVLDISAPSSASGDTSTITLTATEDGVQTPLTFTVDVVANSIVDPPFLGTINTTYTTAENTPITITLPATNPDGATLQYEIVDPSTDEAPADVTIGTFDTATGQVTLTPTTGFTGTISLLAGVSGTNAVNTSYDTQEFVLNVTAAVAPSAPTNLTATSTASTTIDLAWTAPSGTVTGYNIYRGTTSGGESTTPLNSTPLAASATSYQDTTGVAGTTYYYVIQAINSNTTSPNSNEASATVPTNPILPPSAPVAVTLAPSSQTGLIDDDNYTSQSAPVIDATAAPGAVVTFSVNGQTVTATADASGLAQATLPAADLQVGANSVSVTQSNAAGASNAATMTVTYAPNYTQVYTVPGTPGSSQTLTLTLTSRQAAFADEIGVYEVTNSAGDVDGLAPGSAGYDLAAIGGVANGGQFAQVVFTSGDTGGETENITVTGGEQLAFYMIQNNTTANFLADNPTDAGSKNADASQPLAFFTTTSANPDNLEHVKVVSDVVADPTVGGVQYAWEDEYAGGDKDYNDMVMTVALSGGQTSSPEALLAPDAGSGNTVNLSAKLESGAKDAKTPGDVGVFYVDDPSGDIGSLSPSDPGYLAAALASGNYQVLFGAGRAANASTQITVPAGQYLGFFSVSSGTTANLLNVNSANSVSTGLPNAFMTFTSANPDQEGHFSWTSPEGVATNPTATNLHVLDTVYGDSSNINDLDLDLSFTSGG